MYQKLDFSFGLSARKSLDWATKLPLYNRINSDRPIWKFSFNRYRYRYEENNFTYTDQMKKKITDTDADTDMKNC